MTPDAYRLALADLGLSHSKAADAIEISKRTSLRYAKHGVPTIYAERIKRRLDRLAAEKSQ